MTAELGKLLSRALLLTRGKSSTAAVVQTVTVRIVLLVVNFGTGIIVARSLGAVGRGEQSAIALWPLFLATLMTVGIPTSLKYQTSRQRENGPQYYVAAVVMMAGVGVVAAAVGALMMPFLLHGYDLSVVRMAQAFMIFAPEKLVTYVVRSYLEARGDFRRSILAQLNPNILSLLALAALSLSGHLIPITAALAYAIPAAVQMLWLAVRLWPRTRIKVIDIIGHARVLLGYGVRSYGTDVISALASQLDLAVIVTFLSPAALGLYTVALTLSRLLNIVQQSLVTVVFPRASGLESEPAISLVTRTARLSTVFSIALGALFLLIIPLALPRLYGQDFTAAIPLMPLLTVEAIVGGLGSVLCQSFLACGRPFVVTLIEAGSIVTALAFLFLLVPRMSVTGAAMALLCTSIVRLGVVLTAFPLVLDRPIPRLLPDTEDLMYLRSKLRAALPSRSTTLAKEM